MTSTRPRDVVSPEMIDWLQGQIAELQEHQKAATSYLEQLQRQVHGMADQLIEGERAVREIEPRFIPFQGVPDKLREVEEGQEHIRQEVVANRAETENALRLVAAESQYDREERAELSRRVEDALQQITTLASDTARVQSQSVQFGQMLQTLVDRQREVEEKAEHLALRVERVMEVNHDMEARIRREFKEYQDERFDVVFERLQVVGEMVRRSEELVTEVTSERSIREDVLQEVAVWRDQQGRLETRLAVLEESGEQVVSELDKLRSDLTLLEGRHSGLGERVGTIRRDIAEVVDHVRDEFTKFSKMLEKQRRAQIGALEQELREMKFHAFRPPEEP